MANRSGSFPVWKGPRGGSGCDNPECPGKDRYVLVLSVEEIERTFPKKDRLPTWPIPRQATHMCTRCGFCYNGRIEEQNSISESDAITSPDFQPEDWDWEPEMAWTADTARDAVSRFIRGAPDGADAETIADGVARQVPGAGRELAWAVLTDLDLAEM